MVVGFIAGQVTCHNFFKKYLVRVGRFLVDWYSASCCCSMLIPPEKLWNGLCINCVSELWCQGDGRLLKVREQARNGIQILLLFVWEKESLKAKKNKGSLCFPKCVALKNISSEVLLNWCSSSTLWGENSSCSSLAVSGLRILCFHTLSYRLIGLNILCLGRFLWAV